MFSLFAIIIVGYAFYLFNPFHYYFLNDDLIHIPLSKNGELFQRQSFRPIGDLSVQLDYILWGKKAWGYHLTNLILHVFNTVLVFILAKSLFKKYIPTNNSCISGAMVSLLFFVYAFHSESIFWILGRSASLGTLFFIPALLFYLKRNKGAHMLLLSLLFFELGLLSYESVWIFPLVVFSIVLLDYKYFGIKFKKEAKFLGLVFSVFIIHLFIRYLVINQFAGAYEAAAFIHTDYSVLAMNFVKLLGRGFIPPVNNAIIFVASLVPFAILLMLFFFLSVKPQWPERFAHYFSWWILFIILLSLTPYLSLGIDTHGVEGERYLYLPSLFICILFVSGLRFISSKKLQHAFFLFIILFHLFFLSKSASNFKTASKIAQTTFTQLNLLKGKKHLFIDSLPQSFKGALIFRLGFEEGVNFLKNPYTANEVMVLSVKADNRNWSDNYQVKRIGELPYSIINSVLIQDSTNGAHRQKDFLNYQFNKDTDAWFIFKNDGLEVIK